MNDMLEYSNAANAAAQLVPASYAEKAMASLMQLHSELMDEKERRVELHRRLMEREQSIAELKMYVKLLEEKQAPAPLQAAPQPPAPATDHVMHAQVPSLLPRRAPPMPMQVGVRTRPDGWKVW